MKIMDKVLKVFVGNRLSLSVLFIEDKVNKSSITEEKVLKIHKNV